MSLFLFLALLFGIDGGAGPVMKAAAIDDSEVVNNLELLESLDETSDLELLQELSGEN